MPNLGVTELVIISVVVVLLFGVNKIPKLGGAIGESIKNFKKGINDDAQKSLEESKKSNDDPLKPQ